MTCEEVKEAVSNIPTFITDEDIECYFKYANKFDYGWILDLGTGWGKSMLSLALSNKTNAVISCDPGDYPIYQNWAKDTKEYGEKINKLIEDNDLVGVVTFYPIEAKSMVNLIDTRINLIHIDNWVEINNTDSSPLLDKCVDLLFKDGYLLVRNYGRSDREGWNESVGKITGKLKRIETMGLITVFQK